MKIYMQRMLSPAAISYMKTIQAPQTIHWWTMGDLAGVTNAHLCLVQHSTRNTNTLQSTWLWDNGRTTYYPRPLPFVAKYSLEPSYDQVEIDPDVLISYGWDDGRRSPTPYPNHFRIPSQGPQWMQSNAGILYLDLPDMS